VLVSYSLALIPGHRYNSSLAAIKHFEIRLAAKPRLKILSDDRFGLSLLTKMLFFENLISEQGCLVAATPWSSTRIAALSPFEFAHSPVPVFFLLFTAEARRRC
jgi:hypothetical protein